jgi:TatD DNase family protein
VTAPSWIDSHCHIQDTYRPEESDTAALLAAAASAGVEGLVCIGTDAATSRQAIGLARGVRASPGADDEPSVRVWATVGLHPHDAVQGTDQVATLLSEVASDEVVVGVGECGLDYHYDHSPRPVQRRAFAEQIELARRHHLALVVHTREAWDDTLDLLRQAEGLRVVVHCFTGGPDDARKCLDLGTWLSFSGIVTFPNAVDVREAAALCPLDRLLVETDAPFLAPVPHRGRANQPALVPLVGAAVAAAKGVSVDAVAESSAAAARELFGLS